MGICEWVRIFEALKLSNSGDWAQLDFNFNYEFRMNGFCGVFEPEFDAVEW